MLKYLTCLIAIMLMVQFGDSRPYRPRTVDPKDSTYFLVIFYYFNNFETLNIMYNLKKGAPTTLTLWPNGVIIYDISAAYIRIEIFFFYF